MTRVCALTIAFLLAVTPAQAQFGIPQVVFDPKAVAQAIQIYRQIERQYVLWEQITRRMQTMRDYPSVALALGRYAVGRHPGALAILDALNDGDPDGRLYETWAPPITRGEDEDGSAVARAIDFSDAIARRILTESAAVRANRIDIGRAIAALERDVLDPRNASHQMNANLDKLTGASLISARQQDAALALSQAALDQRMVDQQRQRQADAVEYEASRGLAEAFAQPKTAPAEWWTGR